MASNFISQRFQAYAVCSQYPFLVCNSFDLLLLLIVFTPVIRTFSGIVVIVLFVLVVARILCIYCGKYLYKLPGGMQI